MSITPTSNNDCFTLHLLKLTNRYLIQKVNLKSYLQEKELEYLRTLLSINHNLAKNVMYFTKHTKQQSLNDDFLEEYHKYFVIDDRCFAILGKRHFNIMAQIKGKPAKNYKFSQDGTQLQSKRPTQNFWRFIARTTVGWEYNSSDGARRRFFKPIIIKDKNTENVLRCGVQIDKEKLAKQFNEMEVWNTKFKDDFEAQFKMQSPNGMMYLPLLDAAYYKNVDQANANNTITHIQCAIDYSHISSFNEQLLLQIDQPLCITNVKLKFYQSSNVGWMANVENNLANYAVTYNDTVELSRGLHVNLTDKTFHNKAGSHHRRIPKGGGLFDEVGLGKTLSMITLVALNQRKMIDIPKSIAVKNTLSKKRKKPSASEKIQCEAVIQSKSKKGQICGNAVNKPSANSKTKYTFEQLKLYRCCLRHSKKVIGDPEKPNTPPPLASLKKGVASNTPTSALNPLAPTSSPSSPSGPSGPSGNVDDRCFQIPTQLGRYVSKATLVICPNQIPYQWLNQIEQYTEPKMKVVMLANIHEARKTSYFDMIEADFVITTFNALERGMCDLDPMHSVKCEHPPKKLPSLSTNVPKLCHFQFHRIIIDEVHEIIDSKYKKMLPKLFELKTNYKWCISGTPFQNPILNYDLMITWLYDGEYRKEDRERLFALIQPNFNTFKKLFRRNTKESVQKVVPIKDNNSIDNENHNDNYNDMLAEQKMWQSTSEEVIWLDLSSIERSMYNARLMSLGNWANPDNDTYLRQICCSPTLNTENRSVVNDLNYDARRGNANAQQVKEALIEKTRKLVNDMNTKEIPERIQKVWTNLQAFKDDPDDKKTRMAYYTSIHHLKRTFFRLFQLKKSRREFENPPSNAYRYQRAPRTPICLFKCASCMQPVIIHEKLSSYEVDTVKTDMRFGISECGHFFCGKCSFDTFAYKLQIDEVKIKPSKKKRKVDAKQKMGSCVYGYTRCQMPECKKEHFDGNDVILISPKVQIIGLPNALTIQANATIVDEKEHTNRELSPVHTTQRNNEAGIPEYVTGIFKEEYECNVNLYGTKVTNLIAYLKTYTTPPYNQRVIIFSQYDNFLGSLKDTLTQFGMACVMCKGNVFQKRKATTHFKNNPKYRIILLSSKFSASGLDLIEANKIVFVDPVYGDYKKVSAIETQAIGRAHRLGQKHAIKVVRFLIKNTIEESCYKKYK